MRLATLAVGRETRAAVIRDGRAAPLSSFADVGALLEAGEDGLREAEHLNDHDFAVFDESDLRCPVLRPRAVVCVGLNYKRHIEEMGRELPGAPTLFAKLPSTLCDPGAAIDMPSCSDQVDYEGELVVVIGTGGRDIGLAEANRHIAGYTLMNDVSMRDFQYRTLQWFAGKNFERSTPVGPLVLCSPDFDKLGRERLSVRVNGELRQDAELGDLLFEPAALVAEISKLFTLSPGDLIATGTPGGVGFGMKPQQFLADGDVVEVSVPSLGTLRNTFRRSQ